MKVKTVEPTTQNCDRTSIRLKILRTAKMRVRKRRYRGWLAWSFLHGKSAGRFSRHSKLNTLIKQSLSSTHIPFVLEPRHLYRTDQKRPDGLTLVPWAVGKQLLWDVSVVDSLAPCRINAGSVCNPGTAAAEAEERKIDKYKDLVNDGYLFQPLALKIQGAAGPSTEIFLSKFCKNLSICIEEPRAGSFLKQRISLAIQIANAACVLGTINDKITREFLASQQQHVCRSNRAVTVLHTVES